MSNKGHAAGDADRFWQFAINQDRRLLVIKPRALSEAAQNAA